MIPELLGVDSYCDSDSSVDAMSFTNSDGNSAKQESMQASTSQLNAILQQSSRVAKESSQLSNDVAGLVEQRDSSEYDAQYLNEASDSSDSELSADAMSSFSSNGNCAK